MVIMIIIRLSCWKIFDSDDIALDNDKVSDR